MYLPKQHSKWIAHKSMFTTKVLFNQCWQHTNDTNNGSLFKFHN